MKKTSLLVMVFILVVFQQCYDSGFVKPGASTAQVLQEVKDWYGKGLTTRGPSLTSKIGFTSIALWNHARAFTAKKGDGHIVVTPLLAHSQKQPQSTFQLIAFRNKKKIQGFILQLIPDKDYLIKKYQSKEKLAFSGQIKIKSKSGKQMKTFLFKEGKRIPFVKGISSTFRTMDEGDYSGEGDDGGDSGDGSDSGDSGDSGDEGDGTTLDEVTIVFDPNAVDVLEYDDDSTMLDLVTIIGTPIYDFNDYTYLWLNGYTYSGSIEGCILADINGDGVQDVGIPIPVPPDNITNELKDPCLNNVLNSLIDSKLKNDITALLVSTFGKSDEVNVTFIEDSSITNPYTTGGPQAGGVISIEVYLPSALGNSSKEYVAETIFHEIIHAYLDAQPTVATELNQHMDMAQNYINSEKAALQEVFPSLSNADATALILAGFGQLQSNDPAYFDQLLANNNTDANSVAATNDSYKSSQQGTPCK